jgi:hypothetical protein
LVGTGVDAGCWATKVGDSTDGERAAGGASVEGRGEASASTSTPAASPAWSSFAAPESAGCLGGSCGARLGLSGREPRSDEGRDESALSAPLLTAFARRSCRRDVGLLRDELREAAMPSALLASPNPTDSGSGAGAGSGCLRTWLYGQLLLCSRLLGAILLARSITWPGSGVALGVFSEDVIQARFQARYGAVPPALATHRVLIFAGHLFSAWLVMAGVCQWCFAGALDGETWLPNAAVSLVRGW